ncbi:OmpA family protein [Bacteroides ovatus]|jgi:outer membrane protein OmpA-like peptidoglycan-associated protein|uniref:OmpA family protein n=1 Tax=Bacteroides ovatus TaxID=28116 RepID=UPI00233E889F|nr:OmpA family protein [Bacteroides ovatus]MDC2436545.1 OmpA family protein [Bacteroides ovatus]MDC2452176.1 OmpA family protein [Bacteroides ovatus]MDC2467458.1 OmpA family protein [Bacteroides ovatus]MDC2487419.1 OmpA family protein [Bacteroides ovatus]
MKIKYHILLVTILMCTSDVFAWQSDDIKQQAFSKDEGKTVFSPHWVLSAQGGGAYTLGETNFGDLVSPSLAIALGYKFTPLFGVRAEVSGWQAKGGWVNPDITYTYKYLQGSVDAMLDLGNLCCGFNPKRFFNAYLFLGAGLNGAFDNDEAVNLNASGYKLQRLWTGKKLYIAGRIGLGTNLRLNDHVAINLEVNTNMLSDKFNSKKGDNADWQFNGLVGLSFTLGKSYRKTTIISNEPEEAVSTLLVVEQPEKLAVVGQLELKKETTISEPMKQDIFFALNSARIQNDQQSKIVALVEYLKKYPVTKVNVTGYADVNTGNARINSKLSEARAKNVAEALKSKGIAADRIIVDFKGDTVQPYSTPKENRVSICITE